ncbi:SbcC/MukB-like Walker B domain-containing protein [Hymenobacter pini]|uniref:SbcC/MukB-like Walker B domain-containing protein n=1 Tax=Hymenobacter pini TaxID=2880879 RepID=UPI001CF5141A|nr:SbcC/MukB-like Walker B domain-containing protein [Hymenobacter pini]MCA8831157.1 AAA family ATPase [Hymenobacter pini]
MKILRVRFFNLNSLRGEHAVDFSQTPLSDAGLFAITGPTGAGKTTILDAITLALYGQVPRHESSGPEHVMSHGTGESWAEVEFEVNGQQYRSKWGQYRARKQPGGKLQDPKMELSERKTAEDGTETWPFLETYKSKVPPRIAELSGLEYKQFLRSVLLAQGDFTRFLKAPAGERAQLLEKITDTRKYSDISRAAFERAKQENLLVEQLRQGLEGVTLLSPEEVAHLQTELQNLNAQLAKATATQEQWREARQWHLRLQELREKLRTTQQRQQELTAQAETLAPLRQRLALHQQAAPFATDHALLLQTERQLSTLQQETATLQSQLPQLQQATAAAETASTAATQAHEQAAATLRIQEPRLREAELLDHQLREKQQQLEQGKQEYQEQNQLWKQQNQEATTADQQSKLQRQQARELREWLLPRTVLSTVAEALPPLSGYLQDWQYNRTELTELSRNLQMRQQQLAAATATEQASSELLRTAQTQLATATEQQTTASATRLDWRHQLSHHVARLHREETTLETSLQDLRRLMHAHQLILTHEEARQQLQAGEPCPLCGALEHPYAAGVLGVSEDSVQRDREREQALTQQIVTLKGRINRLVSISGLLETDTLPAAPESTVLRWLSEEEETTVPAIVRGLVQELRTLEQQQQEARLAQTKAEADQHNARQQQQQLQTELQQLTLRLQDAQEQAPKIKEIISSLLKTFGLEFSGENGPELVRRLEQASATYRQKLQEAEKLERELELTQERANAAQQRRQELQQWLDKRKAELQASHAELQQLQQRRQELLPDADVAQARQQLETALLHADQHRQRLDQQLQQHRTALSVAADKLQQREQAVSQQQRELQERRAALVQALTAAGLSSDPATLPALLLPHAEATTVQAELQRYEQAVHAASQTAEETTQQLTTEENRRLTTEPLEAVSHYLAAAGEQLAGLHQQVGQRQERLNAHQAGQQRHAALAAQLEKQQQEARRWRQLAEVIGSADGKKFSEFAQGLTLARLVDLANRHLHRFTDRYRILRNTEQHLDLLIQDEYQAGAVRTMNSLSGGESFLVSLALALGLSELAGRRTQIDTLFIDEGFGTLDPDTLDVALSALELLQGTGKTIGIISHVEGLKERISTQISVKKGAGGISSLQVLGFGQEV